MGKIVFRIWSLWRLKRQSKGIIAFLPRDFGCGKHFSLASHMVFTPNAIEERKAKGISNQLDRLLYEPGNGAPTPELGGIDNNLNKRENNSVMLVKVGEQVKKNESIENYENWLLELIEQCKQDNRTLKRVLFFSLTMNVILAAVVLFR